MEDIFKPHSLTIKLLFGNADALYQIPRYQRPYSWNDDQLEKLWEDLRDAQANEPNYFLGSIITAKPEESSNYLDIVDGQQRLTTLLIMLCVYRDLYPNINQDLLDTDPYAIDSATIRASIKFNDRFERLRLRTHDNHASDFETLVLANGATIENDKPYKKDINKEEEPKFKFENTSYFFKTKLKELGEKEAGAFINYVFNSVKIIRIDCHSVSFAIKLFQVLNDRGLDLSNSDLIKSFLIMRIHQLYKNEPELKKQKENQFMDDWKFCENIAIDTEESLNELFVLYEYFILEDNPKRSLYDHLKEDFATKDPNTVIIDFKKFLLHYKRDVYERTDGLMYGFWYLRWSTFWRTCVLTALHSNYREYEEFLVVLRRYFYINWIAGNTLTRVKQTSFNLIKWLKKGESLSFIKEQLEENMNDKSNNTIQRAISALNSDIYFEPWCKPLLFLIEYKQQDNPPYYTMGDKLIHVEHILPRGYDKNEDWNYFQDVEWIEDWINSGGNLTLLSGSKNISASNEGFDRKIVAYDGTGHHSHSDSKISSFKITQNIVNDYNSAKFNKQWNVESINARWVWFCNQVEQILEIDLSEIKSNLLEK